jgi:hypothetical protein
VGTDASGSVRHPLAVQIELGAPIALPLQEFQCRDLAFDRFCRKFSLESI